MTGASPAGRPMRTHQSLDEDSNSHREARCCHGDPIRTFCPYGKASTGGPGFFHAVASREHVIDWHAHPSPGKPARLFRRQRSPKAPKNQRGNLTTAMVAPVPPLSHRTAGNLLGKVILPGSTACRVLDSFLRASPKHACQPTNRGWPQGDPSIAARSIQPLRGPCGSRVTPSTRTYKPPFPPPGAMPAVTTPSLNHCQPIDADPPPKNSRRVNMCDYAQVTPRQRDPQRETSRSQCPTLAGIWVRPLSLDRVEMVPRIHHEPKEMQAECGSL